MAEDRFWGLIEDARHARNVHSALTTNLKKLSAEEIIAFQRGSQGLARPSSAELDGVTADFPEVAKVPGRSWSKATPSGSISS